MKLMINKRKNLISYVREQGASQRLLDVLHDMANRNELPHKTVSQFTKDIDNAIDKYSNISGKLRFELLNLTAALDEISSAESQTILKSKRVKIRKVRTVDQKIEPLFSYLDRHEASEQLLSAIVDLEDINGLPHKTIQEFMREGIKASEKYRHLPGFEERILAELKTLTDNCFLNPLIDRESKELVSTHDMAGKSRVQADSRDLLPPTSTTTLMQTANSSYDRSNITFLDLIKLVNCSYRLQIGLASAVRAGHFPYQTIKQYIDDGRDTKKIIQSVPNMGRKTADELEKTIDVWLQGVVVVSSGNSEKQPDQNLFKSSSDISFAELLDIANCTVRLKNSIFGALNQYTFPYRTIGDYVNDGRDTHKLVKSVPNMGRKTAEEFENIVDAWIRGDLTTNEVKPKRTMDSFTDISFKDLVEFADCSIRLKNSINGAIKEGKLPYQTIGDYLDDGRKIQRVTQSVPNMGKKTAKEFDQLVDAVTKSSIAVSAKPKSFMQTIDYFEPIPGNLFSQLSTFIPPNQLQILKLRVAGKSLEECGLIQKLTRERIRQIEKKALKRIRHRMLDYTSSLAILIDKQLDDCGGEVPLKSIRKQTGFHISELKILIHVVRENLKVKSRIKNDILFRVSKTDEQVDWDTAINDSIYVVKWPIKLADIERINRDIPPSYIERFLVGRRGATIERRVITKLTNAPKSMIATLALRYIGKPASPKQIASVWKEISGSSTNTGTVNANLGKMENALIVERGVYALYDQLELASREVESIRDESYTILYNASQFLSSKLIYDSLIEKHIISANSSTPYVVHGILQDDKRFVVGRGLMIGLQNFSKKVTLKPLQQEISDCVDKFGPISIEEIIHRISPRRKVIAVNVSQNLDRSTRHVRISPGIYESVERLFGSAKKYEQILNSLMIILTNKPATSLDVRDKIRNIGLFGSLDMSNSTLISILRKIQGIKVHHGIYSVPNPSENIALYNWIVDRCLHTDATSEQAKLKVKRLQGGIYAELAEVDYRFYASNKVSKMFELDELDSLLNSF